MNILPLAWCVPDGREPITVNRSRIIETPLALRFQHKETEGFIGIALMGFQS
jgi:hypothetical protein